MWRDGAVDEGALVKQCSGAFGVGPGPRAVLVLVARRLSGARTVVVLRLVYCYYEYRASANTQLKSPRASAQQVLVSNAMVMN